MSPKKFFISHSYEDRLIADRIIDKLIIPYFRIEKIDIFYTSKRDTGIDISLNWKDKIKKSIKECEIFIAIITQNYKNSEMCIGELGAAWVLDKKIYPLVFSPIEFKNFSAIVSELQADSIEKSDGVNSFLKSLKSDLKPIYKHLEIDDLNKKDIITKFNMALRKIKRDSNKKIITNKDANLNSKKNIVMNQIKNEKSDLIFEDEEYRDNMDIIQEQSKIKWPNDNSMQQFYINEQKDSLKKIIQLLTDTNNPELLSVIYNKVKLEWPKNFKIQLDLLNEQIDSYKKLKKKR